MIFLANHASCERALVSDNTIYQSLLYQPVSPPEPHAHADNAFRLAAAVFNTAIPQGLDKVPIGRLIRLREEYAPERSRFQQKVAEFAGAIEPCKSDEAVRDTIERHRSAIENEVSSMKEKLLSADL